MEKTEERRAEQRLRYRWPVRFARDPREKSLAGQMFDLSSTGMSMLFHANEDCPRPDQSITANFGVPHFDAHGSFDTAYFNRLGRVCRVDRLTSRVNRVAIQFTEPLFFNPGEQGIAESDAQQRLQAKTRSAVRARGNRRASAEADVQDLVRLRQEADNKAKAEAERRAVAEAQSRESARLYEQEIARFKAEAAREIARLKDETSYKVAEAKAEVRAKLLAQAKARKKGKKQAKKKEPRSGKDSLAKKVEEFITDRSQVY